jgi:putative flavoprotein involved in K+ transport
LRDRWDSLVLFTPRRYDSLPGLAFPGDPVGCPTRDEVVAYLEQYVSAFALPVQLNRTVRSLTKNGRRFDLRLDGRGIEADQVVIATGPFQTPRVPSFANQLAPDVFQPTAFSTGGQPASPTARSWLSVAATPAT